MKSAASIFLPCSGGKRLVPDYEPNRTKKLPKSKQSLSNLHCIQSIHVFTEANTNTLVALRDIDRNVCHEMVVYCVDQAFICFQHSSTEDQIGMSQNIQKANHHCPIYIEHNPDLTSTYGALKNKCSQLKQQHNVNNTELTKSTKNQTNKCIFKRQHSICNTETRPTLNK